MTSPNHKLAIKRLTAAQKRSFAEMVVHENYRSRVAEIADAARQNLASMETFIANRRQEIAEFERAVVTQKENIAFFDSLLSGVAA